MNKEYKIASDKPYSGREYPGRPKNKNNDDDLIKFGVIGIGNKYNNYSEAGRDLASRAREIVFKKEGDGWVKEERKSAMSDDKIAIRLARKISKKHKEVKNT